MVWAPQKLELLLLKFEDTLGLKKIQEKENIDTVLYHFLGLFQYKPHRSGITDLKKIDLLILQYII